MKYLPNCFIYFLYLTQFSSWAEVNIRKPAANDWLITRNMWLAAEHNNTVISDNFKPLSLVIISHTVSSECNSFQSCAAELRKLQSYFLSYMNSDIPYNFIIGNDGRVYEGRGWNKVGAHTMDYNRCTMGLAFVGDYREGLPQFSRVTALQQIIAHKLFQEGVKLGYLRPDFHVLGAKDLVPTISPGSNLYNAIKQWPNYDHENRYRGKSCEEIKEL